MACESKVEDEIYRHAKNILVKQDWILNDVKLGEPQSQYKVNSGKCDLYLPLNNKPLLVIECRTRTFSDTDGEATVREIINALQQSRKVIIDTFRLADEAELLIGSIIAHEILHLYKTLKEKDKLQDRPAISIVIEEAPRVLSDEVLRTSGSNIYSDIAREGRKFKIGLIAITQLTSDIRSYKEQTRIEIPPGRTLFQGDIGCGKSTILSAIEFALFGLGDIDGGYLLRSGEKKGSVSLEFEVKGKSYQIHRSLLRRERNVVQDKCCIVDGYTTTN
jgi:AAA domain